ncbi:hypothetical protein ACJJTC_007917 [Scirpophaga incertulas]
MMVTWTQFCKDALPERNHTFWEWFYMVVKVTRDYLRTLWCDGFNEPNGQFLRRLAGVHPKGGQGSAKCPAGISFRAPLRWAAPSAFPGEASEVFSLQPFTSRDLMLRSLADRVLDLPQLQFLYPNIAKDTVFSKYYTKPANWIGKY